MKKIKLSNLLYYIYLIVLFVYILAFTVYEEFPQNIYFALFFCFPIILFLILKKLEKNINWLYSLLYVIQTIIMIIMPLIFFVFGVFLAKEHSVPRFLTAFDLHNISSRYGVEKWSHFPRQIPINAKNYYFNIDHGWDGSFDLMYFNIDEDYIKDYEIKNKSKCKVYGMFSEINDKYYYSNFANFEGNENICFFNLKALPEDDYTRGYAVKGNRIYYFYQN